MNIEKMRHQQQRALALQNYRQRWVTGIPAVDIVLAGPIVPGPPPGVPIFWRAGEHGHVAYAPPISALIPPDPEFAWPDRPAGSTHDVTITWADPEPMTRRDFLRALLRGQR